MWSERAVHRGVVVFSAFFIISISSVTADDVTSNQTRTRISQQKCSEYSNCLDPRPVSKILNDVGPYDGEYPYVAAIGFNDSERPDQYTWTCVGSLISDVYVVTVAHCLLNPLYGNAKAVRLGARSLEEDTEGLQVIPVDSSTIHPSYKRSSYYHDVALLKLVRSAVFTEFVRPVCLYQSVLPPEAGQGLVTGWGISSYDKNGRPSSRLLNERFSFNEEEECRGVFPQHRKLRDGFNFTTHLCATHVNGDICQGASGAPLIVQTGEKKCVHHLVGIMTFGKSCGLHHPTAFTRVFTYLEWIEGVVWPGQ